VPIASARRQILKFDAGNLSPFRIHECDLARGHMLGPDSRQDSHPIDSVGGRTTDVDCISAGTDGWGALDECHVETVFHQPIGQSWAGDARARHEDSSGMSAIHDSRFSGHAARKPATDPRPSDAMFGNLSGATHREYADHAADGSQSDTLGAVVKASESA